MNVANKRQLAFLSRRRTLGIVTVVVVVAILITMLVSRPWSSRFVPPPGSTIPWAGENWFLLGVNYPWNHYGNDFGANGWGSYGVGTGGDYEAQFADLDERGVHVLRWWVFADGRAGITTDKANTPTGIDEFVVRDVDRALDLATDYGIHLNLVLFDVTLLAEAEDENGVQIRGRTDWIADGGKRTALVDRVIEPLLDRYGGHPQVMMWEVMNEPEWAISDLPQADVHEDNVPVTRAQFWDFAARVVDVIH
jgi:hypothetical protein